MRYIAILIGCLSIIGCSQMVVYEQDYTPEQGVWKYGDIFANQVTVEDTTQYFNLFLDLQHSDEFDYQNIYCQVTTTFPNGKKVTQQLPIDFADKKGKWYGKCSGGKCKVRAVLKEHIKFAEVGTYHFDFEQYSRQAELRHIDKLTFTVNKSDK